MLDGDAQQAACGKLHIHHLIAHGRHHRIDHGLDTAHCCRNVSNHLVALSACSARPVLLTAVTRTPTPSPDAPRAPAGRTPTSRLVDQPAKRPEAAQSGQTGNARHPAAAGWPFRQAGGPATRVKKNGLASPFHTMCSPNAAKPPPRQPFVPHLTGHWRPVKTPCPDTRPAAMIPKVTGQLPARPGCPGT